MARRRQPWIQRRALRIQACLLGLLCLVCATPPDDVPTAIEALEGVGSAGLVASVEGVEDGIDDEHVAGLREMLQMMDIGASQAPTDVSYDEYTTEQAVWSDAFKAAFFDVESRDERIDGAEAAHQPAEVVGGRPHLPRLVLEHLVDLGQHGRVLARGAASRRARSWKRPCSFANCNFTVPIGPLRCLEMMISASPMSGLSSS